MTDFAQDAPHTLGVNDLDDMCQNDHPGQPAAKSFNGTDLLHPEKIAPMQRRPARAP
jgi:hypothetical protein